MLKAEFMKLWLFRFSIIKLSFQLRYYRMNENSKCDISFIYADTWHATQNKSFRSDLWTSRTLKMCQYQNPWVTKPVLCPFLNLLAWLVVYHSSKKIPEILVEKFWSVRTVRVVYHLPKISGLSRRARLDSSYNMKLVRIGHFHDDDVWLELPEFISPSLSY